MASTGETWRLGRRPARSTTLADRFEPRNNAIGFFRLALALVVVFDHAVPLGGFGTELSRQGHAPGGTAVIGFFALSGFLITRSAQSSPSVARFLWHRFLRIFPGFWACLVVVAVVFAPVASMVSGVAFDPWAAAGYVINNWLLQIRQIAIGPLLSSNPLPSFWDGSLWTLVFEFECYLLVAGLRATRLLRGPVVAGLALAAWLLLQAHMAGMAAMRDDNQLRFTLAFLVGSLLWLYRDRIPASRNAIWTVLAVAVGTLATTGFSFAGEVAFSYLVVLLAAAAPFRRVGVKRDLSYGVYIYGWPVQQMLVLLAVNRLGYLPYVAATLAGTLALAIASWRLIESPALRLKHAAFRGVRQSPSGSPTGQLAHHQR